MTSVIAKKLNGVPLIFKCLEDIEELLLKEFFFKTYNGFIAKKGVYVADLIKKENNYELVIITNGSSEKDILKQEKEKYRYEIICC